MTKVYGTGLYDFRRHRVAEYPVAAVSIIIMVNEKFRENVAAWTCFHERKDAFKGFLESVLRLKEGRELSIAEKTNYLVFMINAFQSLEDVVVSRTILRLANLKSWYL
ncbi:hypothetical protein AAZX31_04G149800 [Glycine max]|uniref:RNA helicase aquarius-like isoform X2 n=1 Tax=Glycine soja TaxID=3848 RepID=UPI00103D4C65|nr:RNA helicase aquarius-like isoform X2 [Glycine soja]XP_028229019.1 RNA helicase aquarius-like isoform X2 [Glycine soja]